MEAKIPVPLGKLKHSVLSSVIDAHGEIVEVILE